MILRHRPDPDLDLDPTLILTIARESPQTRGLGSISSKSVVSVDPKCLESACGADLKVGAFSTHATSPTKFARLGVFALRSSRIIFERVISRNVSDICCRDLGYLTPMVKRLPKNVEDDLVAVRVRGMNSPRVATIFGSSSLFHRVVVPLQLQG